MASVKFGAIVTDAKGKLGGHVFQKGNQSRVLRTNFKPRQVYSWTRGRTQQIVNDAITNWSKLTFAQKNEWDRVAPQFLFENKFHDALTLTGRNLYIKLWNNCRRRARILPNDPSGIYSMVITPVMSNAYWDLATSRLVMVGEDSAPGQRMITYSFRTRKQIIIPKRTQMTYLNQVGNFNGTSPINFNTMVLKHGPFDPAYNYYLGVESVNEWGFKGAMTIFMTPVI